MSWEIEDAAQPGKKITIRGLDYGGIGRPILLHHANGFCAGTWGLVAAELTKDYRVYAMDARGHGDSDAPKVPDHCQWPHYVQDAIHVASAIAEAHAEPQLAAAVGSSFGGIVCAAAQAEHGALFERLLLLDPPFHPTPAVSKALNIPEVPDNGRRQQLVDITLRRRSAWSSMQALRDSWRDKDMFANWLPEAYELYLEHGFATDADGSVHLKCHPSVEANIFATTGVLDVVEFAPKIRIPLRLVRAKGGHFPRDFFQALTTLFPKGEYLEQEGGHLLPMEVPEACARLLTEWST